MNNESSCIIIVGLGQPNKIFGLYETTTTTTTSSLLSCVYLMCLGKIKKEKKKKSTKILEFCLNLESF